MTPSTTSRKSLAIVIVAALGLIPVNALASTRSYNQPATISDQLLSPPAAGDVWILGNSIFKTGVDPEQLEAELNSTDVTFEYHGGHYTSLWYLIANNALPEIAAKPGVVVWGFRPGYAALPAFRENTINDTELFLVAGDAVYDDLAEPIDAGTSAFDGAATDLDDRLADVALFELRSRAAAKLADESVEAGIAVAKALGMTGGDLVERELASGDTTLLDILNNVVTGGAVQLAEERVVDGVGDFVVGPPAGYADSFVPIIADQLVGLGLDQLVIIWPPRNVATGTPSEEDSSFVDDAVASLRAAGIPVLDLYNDASITKAHYARGDHFNPDGRGLVTSLVADTLRELGY